MFVATVGTFWAAQPSYSTSSVSVARIRGMPTSSSRRSGVASTLRRKIAAQFGQGTLGERVQLRPGDRLPHDLRRQETGESREKQRGDATARCRTDVIIAISPARGAAQESRREADRGDARPHARARNDGAQGPCRGPSGRWPPHAGRSCAASTRTFGSLSIRPESPPGTEYTSSPPGELAPGEPAVLFHTSAVGPRPEQHDRARVGSGSVSLDAPRLACAHGSRWISPGRRGADHVRTSSAIGLIRSSTISHRSSPRSREGLAVEAHPADRGSAAEPARADVRQGMPAAGLTGGHVSISASNPPPALGSELLRHLQGHDPAHAHPEQLVGPCACSAADFREIVPRRCPRSGSTGCPSPSRPRDCSP